MLDFSQCLQSFANDDAVVGTLAQVLMISGAKLLELDSRELGTIVVPAGYEGKGLGAVLYDNVPGGAGHAQELLSLGRSWLEEAYKVMFVTEEHNLTCEIACLDCLLTFGAQESMRLGLLQRRLTLQLLDALLKGGLLPVAEAKLNSSRPFANGQQASHQGQSASPFPATMWTDEQRRQRASLKKRK